MLIKYQSGHIDIDNRNHISSGNNNVNDVINNKGHNKNPSALSSPLSVVTVVTDDGAIGVTGSKLTDATGVELRAKSELNSVSIFTNKM